MKHHTTRTSVRLAALALLASPCAFAQTTTQLAPVTVVVRPAPEASVSGWGDVPLAELPLAATAIGGDGLKRSGATRVSDITAADAAISDAYNSEGYWDFVSVRGFTLDNRYNFRRDGLPISAETAIALENKARIEVLKGTSGLQAGTSAPGGLVNHVVKRPLDGALGSASIAWREQGSVTLATDLSRRFGEGGALGLRVNAAVGEIRPLTQQADGRRHLLALAADARLAGGALLEAEVESSRRRQPSVPGFSLLGDAVPAPVDPRINLNNQAWSLPVVVAGTTASVRYTQPLEGPWKLVAHAATQRLTSDDRIAFPFGCTDLGGTYYADRYCPDGSFDLYDFRSDNERRRTDAFDVTVSGRLQALGREHRVAAGVLHSRGTFRFDRQAFNFAGTGRVDGSLQVPEAPALTGENTNRDETATELHLRDAIALAPGWTAWLGARHTRLDRRSVRTDGSEPTAARQSFTTPFAALSWTVAPRQMLYASWSRGVESEVAPNRDRYTNAGAVLPALQSRQWELGAKGSLDDTLDWTAAAFDIRRPLASDVGACDVAASCTRAITGEARHRGIEASLAWNLDAWTLGGSAMVLRARRDDGLVPTNVPERSLRVGAEHRPFAGARWNVAAVHEGPRFVTPDNTARIPGWTRVDAGASLVAGPATWRVGLDNVFDERAWKESPYQFGHAYLFPLAPRTWRASVEVAW